MAFRKLKLLGLSLLAALPFLSINSHVEQPIFNFNKLTEVKAAEQNGDPATIEYVNLAFQDNVYIMYLVKTLNTSSTPSLYIWNEPKEEYTDQNVYKVLTSIQNDYKIDPQDEQTYFLFIYDELSAKQMGDEIYAKAKIDDYYSPIFKYSILEYATSLIKTTSPSSDLNIALKSMLDYGSKMQKLFNYKTDRLVNENFYIVKLEGILFEDGTNKGIVKQGEDLTLTSQLETNSWYINGFFYSNNLTTLTLTDIQEDTLISLSNHEAVQLSIRVKFTPGSFLLNGDPVKEEFKKYNVPNRYKLVGQGNKIFINGDEIEAIATSSSYFDNWDYDFSKPLEKNTTVNALYSLKTDFDTTINDSLKDKSQKMWMDDSSTIGALIRSINDSLATSTLEERLSFVQKINNEIEEAIERHNKEYPLLCVIDNFISEFNPTGDFDETVRLGDLIDTLKDILPTDRSNMLSFRKDALPILLMIEEIRQYPAAAAFMDRLVKEFNEK